MEQYNNLIFLISIFLCLFLVEGSEFRFDYQYSTEADGWLKFHPQPAKFLDAYLRCKAEGALLASPLSKDLRQSMTSLFRSSSEACGIFTGIHATYSRGDFASVEGVPLSRIPVLWAPGEPDNYNGDEDCTLMLHNGTLADVKCNETHPYICYKKKISSPVCTACGTIDTEYIYETRTGSCYKFHRIGLTWRRAYMMCAAEGGYLAIINSEVEAQVIRDLFNKFPSGKIIAEFKDIAAIGNNAPADHSYWLTIHGQTLDEAGYSVFHGGQPDNAKREGQGQYCGGVFRNAQLDDFWCEAVTLPFICEKNPQSLMSNP